MKSAKPKLGAFMAAWTDICSCNICIHHIHVDYAGGGFLALLSKPFLSSFRLFFVHMILPVILNAEITGCGRDYAHNQTADQKRLPDIAKTGKYVA